MPVVKAIVLRNGHGPENLALVDRNKPQPRRQEILIEVRATGLNYRDLEIINGNYHTAFSLPLVPLSDGVGVVTAIGDDVTRFKVGDRVCSTFWQRWVGGSFRMAEPSYQRGGPIDGLLAEYAILDEQAAVHAPANLSDIEAAALPCAAVTAWHALVTEGAIRAGDTVLVLEIFSRQVQVRGIPVGSRESFEAMNRAIEANDLRPTISRLFQWVEAGDAVRYMQTGTHFGKVVLLHESGV
jgi:NADPH:quinone reductase-like Zn-dependent oxidoreductase